MTAQIWEWKELGLCIVCILMMLFGLPRASSGQEQKVPKSPRFWIGLVGIILLTVVKYIVSHGRIDINFPLG